LASARNNLALVGVKIGLDPTKIGFGISLHPRKRADKLASLCKTHACVSEMPHHILRDAGPRGPAFVRLLPGCGAPR
jgi:hypothetical protein